MSDWATVTLEDVTTDGSDGLRRGPFGGAIKKDSQKTMVEAGAGSKDTLQKVRATGELGLFVRSMVGLDREAAKHAFEGFLAGKTLSANQIQFVNLVIDYLTQSGWMTAAQLYESPFTDFSPKGVEGVFSSEQVAQLVGILNDIRTRAAA